MKFENVIFYLALTLLLFQCSSSKNIQFKDGKCYGKCIIPDDIFVDYDEYAVFTGNASEEKVDIEVMEIMYQEKTTKWVKKKSPGNCLSANPDDCLVWCLVEVPEEKEVFTILKDTAQSANYVMKKVEKKVIREKGGFTEWKQVVCEADLSKAIIGRIQNTLRKKGYFDTKNSYKIDSKTKMALTTFQRENNLPVGQLDMESLDVLGIVIE